DSLDGRFDSVALHAFLVLNRLKREDGAEAAAIAQHLVDFFVDLLFGDDDVMPHAEVGDDRAVDEPVEHAFAEMPEALLRQLVARDANAVDDGRHVARLLRSRGGIDGRNRLRLLRRGNLSRGFGRAGRATQHEARGDDDENHRAGDGVPLPRTQGPPGVADVRTSHRGSSL
ncbi:MAG: ubiquinol-cytochrome C chaperone family protein, partial [Planctomycetes bacterium]|nr:ubiquinol-cytochrome C chaperone family protein [Planctomycetota bacterium]